MDKIRELVDRRANLLQTKRSLDSKASNESLEGRKYLQCLVLQVITEIDIEKAATQNREATK